jgi:hypothetical protein
LGKNFYIVIPFTPYELGVAKSAASVTNAPGHCHFPNHMLSKSQNRSLPQTRPPNPPGGKIGLKLKQLSTPQLVELSFTVFNPEAREKKEETP